MTLRRGYSTAVLANFDDYFDRIAADALRYHLPAQGDAGARLRVAFEELIDRLEAPAPEPTSAEDEAMATWQPLFTIAPGYENFPRAQRVYRLTECPPAAHAAVGLWNQRTQEFADRRRLARHELVDLLDRLWT